MPPTVLQRSKPSTAVEWTLQPSADIAPRWAHTATNTPEGMLIIGGFSHKLYRNDAWLARPGGEFLELRASDDARAPADNAALGSEAAFPSARSNHCAIAIGGSVIVLGGGAHKTKFSDAFLLRVVEGAERGALLLQTCALRPSAASVTPSPRAFAAGAELNLCMLAHFGGVDGSGGDVSSLCVGVLDMAPSFLSSAAPGTSVGRALVRLPPTGITWTEFPPLGRPPSASTAAPPLWPPQRRCHVMAAAPAPYTSAMPWGGVEAGQLVLLHGGCHSDAYTPLDDVWVLAPLPSQGGAAPYPTPAAAAAAGVCAVQFPPRSPGAQPPPDAHFGWVKPSAQGRAPSARWGHALVAVPGRAAAEPSFLLTGGYGRATTAASETSDLRDLFVATMSVRLYERGLPMVTITWSQVDVSPDVCYPPRRRLGADILQTDRGGGGGELIIFGGFSGDKYHADAWTTPVDAILSAAGVVSSRAPPCLPSAASSTAASTAAPPAHAISASSMSLRISAMRNANEFVPSGSAPGPPSLVSAVALSAPEFTPSWETSALVQQAQMAQQQAQMSHMMAQHQAQFQQAQAAQAYSAGFYPGSTPFPPYSAGLYPSIPPSSFAPPQLPVFAPVAPYSQQLLGGSVGVTMEQLYSDLAIACSVDVARVIETVSTLHAADKLPALGPGGSTLPLTAPLGFDSSPIVHALTMGAGGASSFDPHAPSVTKHPRTGSVTVKLAPSSDSTVVTAGGAAAAAAAADAAASMLAVAQKEAVAAQAEAQREAGDARREATEARRALDAEIASRSGAQTQLEAARKELSDMRGKQFALTKSIADLKVAAEKATAATAEATQLRAASDALQRRLAAVEKEKAAVDLELYRVKDQLERSSLCVVCETHRRNVLTLPCKHFLLCKECYVTMCKDCTGGTTATYPLCPLCRGDVLSWIEVAGQGK